MAETIEAALESGDFAGAAATLESGGTPAHYDLAARALIGELAKSEPRETIEALWRASIAQPVVGPADNFVPAILMNAVRFDRLDPPAYAAFARFAAPRLAAPDGDTARITAFTLQWMAPGAAYDAALTEFATGSSLSRFCLVFDSRFRANRDALAAWLRTADVAVFSAETAYALAVFASTVDDDIADRILAPHAARNEDSASADGVLAQAARRRHAPRPRAVRAAPKIAVCVSGQLRGYERCIGTWPRLGLDQPNVDFYVHTWRNIGRKYPYAGHADRSFGGAFLDAYRQGARTLGQNGLEGEYPSLFAWFAAGANVQEAALRAMYRTDHVVIEDDSEPTFAKLSNSDKMYSKAERCYEMMRETGAHYDLVIRLRPDKPIASAASLDWRAVHDDLSAERKIYADLGPFLHFTARFAIGDQFAVGDAETMEAYSTAYSQTVAARTAPRYGFPTMCLPHENFAVATFHAGIRVDTMPGVTFDKPVDPAPISVAEIAARVRADVGGAARHEVDRLFLAALEQDMAAP